MHALRLPFAAGSGVLVTLAVFSVLWSLVSVPLDMGPPIETKVIEWKRLIRDTPVEVKRDDKVERPKPPPVPNTPRTSGIYDPGLSTPYAPPERVEVTVDGGGGLTLGQDTDAIPIVRIAPDYPPGPLTRGVEGWVQVRFTVTSIGTVRDAIVVDAEPKKLFDDAALKAIGRWRYNPRIDNGVAVERVGLQTIIRFELEKP